MHTYLVVCITKHLGLLIGCIRIDQVIVYTIGGIRLCGLVFLIIQGRVARVARRFASCCIACFALVGHNVVRINHLGRRARSTS